MTSDLDRATSTRRVVTRRRRVLWVVLTLAVAFLASTLIASDTDTQEEPPMIGTSFQQMFDFSHTKKRGLVLFVQGQTLPGLVISYSDEAVEMRSQHYDRIVVRIDRIDAMAHQ